MTSFGTWGLPQMVQKFYAIKDVKMIKAASIITAIFALVIGITAYMTGILSHVFFSLDTVPKLANGNINYDQIIPTLLTTQLPEILLAIIMLLVLSASMSTLSSLILVSSSAVTIDLYKGYLNPKMSEKSSLIMIRVLSGIFIIFSYVISKVQIGFIVTLMSLSWGCAFGRIHGSVHSRSLLERRDQGRCVCRFLRRYGNRDNPVLRARRSDVAPCIKYRDDRAVYRCTGRQFTYSET